ncbi:unnamed protein product [Rhizophagus irregularis]|nr:unnamed protein product [Rhizophagus irregularis]
MGTNSALCASSSAIKRVMEGRIAHLGHQFGTSCLIPGNQKVREWIVKCLRQIDELQIRHFVPHPAIKKWQLRGKQLCEGVLAPEQMQYLGIQASDSCDLSIIEKLSTFSFKRLQYRMKPITGCQDIPP